MASPKKPFSVPRDVSLNEDLYSDIDALSASVVDEVFHFLDQIFLFGTDQSDHLAIFNNRFEVICREVPGSVFVLLAYDRQENDWMFVGVSQTMPSVQTAMERCAGSFEVEIVSWYIRRPQ